MRFLLAAALAAAIHVPSGYRVTTWATGLATTFATGFDHPLALAVDPSGGLLVADWGRGVIYEIRKR